MGNEYKGVNTDFISVFFSVILTFIIDLSFFMPPFTLISSIRVDKLKKLNSYFHVYIHVADRFTRYDNDLDLIS